MHFISVPRLMRYLLSSCQLRARCGRAVKLELKQIRKYATRNVLALNDRGLFHDMFPLNSTNEIIDLCNGSPQCVYAGFDPTAKSLHLGNLLVIMNLMHWQRGGHQVIALVGGATSRIGDPSGRSTDREEQKQTLLESNTKSITKMLENLFLRHEEHFPDKNVSMQKVKIVDNWEWYSGLDVVDFIGTVGRKLRVGSMMSRSSVVTRLNSESGMSFAEFSYQLFQAYDWLHLLNKFDCRFQIGGSDQMGNIVTGHDLIKKLSSKSVYGLTVPLIVNDLGDKYGKSAQNAVWLDPDMTSHYELYQFLIRTPDNDVAKLLRFFTFRSLGEIDQIMQEHMKEPEKRKAQEALAHDVMLLIRGKEGLETALCATKALYGADVTSLARLDHETVKSVFSGAAQIELFLQPGITIRQLGLAAKCFLDQRAADRIIQAGGFYINHKRSSNPNEVIVDGLHILPNRTTLLRVGKKNYSIVKWIS